MKRTYIVDVYQTRVHQISVEAENEDEAEVIATKMALTNKINPTEFKTVVSVDADCIGDVEKFIKREN